MSSKPRLLFFSHSASRNGATIVLLNLLRWLKEHADFSSEVVVCGSGELAEEFKAVAPTRIWRSASFLAAGLPSPWRRALKPWLDTQSLRALLVNRRYDLAYLNTAAVWRNSPLLAKQSRALLWHIHELDYALRVNMGNDEHRLVFPLANRFVAVSGAVRDTLANRFQVPEEKIDVVNPFIAPVELSGSTKEKRRKIRAELGWPEDAFVVGGCGALGWRKGTDLFLQIAHEMARDADAQKIRFLWVGGPKSGQERLEFEHDLRALGLQDRCVCVPSNSEVLDYYCAMDAFALTSREDPFPLVMLEAGAFGLPVVCFAGSGGGPEFVGEDSGMIAPYLAVDGFVARLKKLRDDADLRGRLGDAAREAVRNKFTLESQAPKILNSIESALRR